MCFNNIKYDLLYLEQFCMVANFYDMSITLHQFLDYLDRWAICLKQIGPVHAKYWIEYYSDQLFCSFLIVTASIYITFDQSIEFTKKKLYPNQNHYPRLKSRSIQKFLMPILFYASFRDLLVDHFLADIMGEFRFVNQIIGLPQNFNPLLAPAA